MIMFFCSAGPGPSLAGKLLSVVGGKSGGSCSGVELEVVTVKVKMTTQAKRRRQRRGLSKHTRQRKSPKP